MGKQRARYWQPSRSRARSKPYVDGMATSTWGRSIREAGQNREMSSWVSLETLVALHVRAGLDTRFDSGFKVLSIGSHRQASHR